MVVFLKKGRLCHYSRPLRLGLRCLLGRLLFVAVGRGYLLAPRGRSLRSLPARSHSLARGEPARFAALRCAARVCFSSPSPVFTFCLGESAWTFRNGRGCVGFPACMPTQSLVLIHQCFSCHLLIGRLSNVDLHSPSPSPSLPGDQPTFYCHFIPRQPY